MNQIYYPSIADFHGGLFVPDNDRPRVPAYKRYIAHNITIQCCYTGTKRTFKGYLLSMKSFLQINGLFYIVESIASSLRVQSNSSYR